MQHQSQSLVVKKGMNDLVRLMSDKVGVAGLGELYEMDFNFFVSVINDKAYDAYNAINFLSRSGLQLKDLHHPERSVKKAIDFIIRKDYDFLPDEFQVAAYTSRSVTNRILNVLCADFGQKFVGEILLALGSSPAAFCELNLKKMVNTEFNQKLYEYLVDEMRLPKSYLFELGKKVALNLKESDLCQNLKKQNKKEVVEFFLDQVSSTFEQSFHYSIAKRVSGQTQIKVDFNPKIKEELKRDSYSGLYSSIYSLGFASTIISFHKDDRTFAQINSSVHVGDCENLWTIYH